MRREELVNGALDQHELYVQSFLPRAADPIEDHLTHLRVRWIVATGPSRLTHAHNQGPAPRLGR